VSSEPKHRRATNTGVGVQTCQNWHVHRKHWAGQDTVLLSILQHILLY